MLVERIEQAESIVSKFNYLKWDGWDILRYKPDPAAFYLVDGVWHNGRWNRLFRYSPGRQGWDLPAFLVQ